MPAAINSKRINYAEHTAIIAHLRASGGDIQSAMTRFNRGRSTIARFAQFARSRTQ